MQIKVYANDCEDGCYVELPRLLLSYKSLAVVSEIHNLDWLLSENI